MAQPLRVKLTEEDLLNADDIKDALGCRGISTPMSVALSLTAFLLKAKSCGAEIMLRTPDGIYSPVIVTVRGEQIHVD